MDTSAIMIKTRILAIVLSFAFLLPVFSHLAYADSPETDTAIKNNQKSYAQKGIAGVILRPTVTLFPYGEGMPVLLCAPFQVCDVSFVPGDVPVQRTIGDGLEWPTSWWVGQSDKGPIYHMVFKPMDEGVQTNVIIGMTNNHSYTFMLKAVKPEQLRVYKYSYYDPTVWSVHMSFPPVVPPQVAQKDQEVAQLKEQVQKLSKPKVHSLTIDPRSVESRYSVSGNAVWKPDAVFDDKVRVFIQFPVSVTQHFRPAFFLVSEDGQLEPDTATRVSPEMLVVPHLFEKGALVYGIGSQRKIVYITREHNKKKHWFDLF